MAGKILPKFQMMGFQSWKGLTSDNHLGALFQSEPQRATNLMVKLLAYNVGSSLESFLAQFPTKYFENDSEFFWDVMASAQRNIPLVEARDENGQTIDSESGANVGAGITRFYLVFAEDWFADGEVIVGHMNEKYMFRILGDAKIEGTNYVYTVELMGANTTGVPRERLMPGERFSVEYAPVEKELSRKVGDVRFSSPISMRNEWTTIRISHKEAGNKLGKKVAFGIPMVREGKNGAQERGTSNMWMHYVDWQTQLEWSGYKNKALAFGRTNRNSNGEYLNFGKSGNVIRMGSGIFEQAEVANVMYYNDTASIMRLILDALYELSEGKLEYSNRKFIIKTGERGALLFNRAASMLGSGWTPLGLKYSEGNPPAITKTTADFAPGTAVRLTDYQITEWQAPNGVFVKLDVDSFYDDKVRNKIYHPEGGVAFSYRFDIWYVGAEEQPNIQKCEIQGEPELWGYEWGFRNPFTGAKSNMNMSYDEDSCVFHKQATFGAVVYDPTRMVSIIPSILQ